MRMIALGFVVSVVLALSACDRKGGNPPKPVTSALQAPAASA